MHPIDEREVRADGGGVILEQCILASVAECQGKCGSYHPRTCKPTNLTLLDIEWDRGRRNSFWLGGNRASFCHPGVSWGPLIHSTSISTSQGSLVGQVGMANPWQSFSECNLLQICAQGTREGAQVNRYRWIAYEIIIRVLHVL